MPAAVLKTRRQLAICILLGLGACTRAPEQTIGDVLVPAQANLTGIRAVSVSIAAVENIAAATTLELRRQDGKVVFHGAMPSGRALSTRVVLPTKDSNLVAVLASPNAAQRSIQLVVVGGTASGSFP